ncbi:MAG TPA: DUF481 domain-containing protein [Thermoanaerobaculia bacterium]|nr:DUF481 domain-containing protein [Thermoanaerobaculia bacterium]
MRIVPTIATIVFCATLNVLAADPPPSGPWTSTIGAGLAVTSGNSDTKNFNLSAATKYDPKTRLVFKAEASYLRGSANGVTQVDKASAAAREEYSVSERAFAFGELSYLRDRFKGISSFISPLAGGGYRIIKSTARNLTVDGAAGAQIESDTGASRSTSGALKAGEDFDWALSASTKFTQKLTRIWKTSAFGDALYHFDAGISTAVSTRLQLKVSYAYDYKTRPPSPAIKKGDGSLIAALVFKF